MTEYPRPMLIKDARNAPKECNCLIAQCVSLDQLDDSINNLSDSPLLSSFTILCRPCEGFSAYHHHLHLM